MAAHKKLTPEIAAQICADVEAGNTIECAAGCAGINKVTVYRWNKLGKEGVAPYDDFAEQLEFARCKAERARVALITAAGFAAKNAVEWAAPAWWLSHARRETWSTTNKHEISGPDGGPIKHVDLSKLTDEQLLRITQGESPPEGDGGDGAPEEEES